MTDASKPSRAAWGYHPVEPAKIFEHGNIPPGWSATPLKGQHPHDVELGIKPEPVPQPQATPQSGQHQGKR